MDKLTKKRNKRFNDKPVKVIIAGGRDFDNPKILRQIVIRWSKLHKITRKSVEGVSGEASGVDKLGRVYLESIGVPVSKFKADWDNVNTVGAVVRTNKAGKPYNVIAGHQRNQEMANYATHLIAIWDGKSKGTLDMINRAKKADLIISVFNYNGDEW